MAQEPNQSAPAQSHNEWSNAASQHVYAVIMAGGIGSRLWPLSRKNLPKQFLDLFGDGTMIEKTVARLSGVAPTENIFIVTNKTGKALVQKQLPTVPRKNILVEPVGRNTAPCIALATAFIKKQNPNAVICTFPADHLIQNEEMFRQTLRAAVEVAGRTRALVTIGIKPDRPETGYGYIQAEHGYEEISTSIKVRFGIHAHKVKTFAEKPDYDTAKGFLASGDFLWNSGIFIWTAESIMREMQRCIPQLYMDMQVIMDAIGTRKEKKTIENVYSWVHPISIDYAVMEKAESVYVLEGAFDWSDAGSWDEIMKFKLPDSPDDEKVFMHNSKNVLAVKPKHKTIAVVDVDDILIIETGDALLICKRGQSQDVKHIVDMLKRKQLEEYI